MEARTIDFELKCDCGRFLGTVNKTTTAKIKCGNSKCRKLKDVKVVFMSDFIKNIHKGK